MNHKIPPLPFACIASTSDPNILAEAKKIVNDCYTTLLTGDNLSMSIPYGALAGVCEGFFEHLCGLAYWQFIFKQETRAVEICTYLEYPEFPDLSFHQMWINVALALKARILRKKGEFNKISPLDNIINSEKHNLEWLVKGNLEDAEMLIQQSLTVPGLEGIEIMARHSLLQRVCHSIELLRIHNRTINHLEASFQKHLKDLRTLLGIEE